MAGPSVWWSTPSRPDAHFSSDELRDSEAYHRPLRLVALTSLGAKVVLLVVAGLIGPSVSRSLSSGDAGGTAGAAAGEPAWGAGVGWIDAMVSGRVAVGAALTVVALRLPAVLSDGWFEYRFRRGLPGYRPLPLLSFLITTAALAVGAWLLLVPVAGLAYRIVATVERWPVVLGLVVVALAVVAALAERTVRGVGPDRSEPVEDGEVATRLAAVGADIGVVDAAFLVGLVDNEHDHPGRGPVNACAMGIGPNRRVVVSPELLAEPAEVRDFIVAHELTHLARRHIPVQAVVAAASAVAVVGALALLVPEGWPWQWFDIAADDPIGLPVTVAVIIAVAGAVDPLSAWISRANERSADAGAVAAVGPLPGEQARVLYVEAMADLDPPWWAGIYAQHPAPAERLEYLKRCRSAAGLNRSSTVHPPFT